MFDLYGKLLGCFEDVRFNELIQYLKYTTKVSKTYHCQWVRVHTYGNDSMEQDDLPDEGTGQSSSKTSWLSMLGSLAATPKRFVNVRRLLQIAATMPLATCSAERHLHLAVLNATYILQCWTSLPSCSADRCFSATKILNSRLRSTMKDELLNGLALIYIRKDMEISLEGVINESALTNRKVDFVLWNVVITGGGRP